MFESILEWILIGLVLINLIALNNWHRVMHIKVQEIAAALNLLVVLGVVKNKISNSSDEMDIQNAIQIMRWDMGEDDGE
jgi:hypothetical protein